MVMGQKTCTSCKENLNLDEFGTYMHRKKSKRGIISRIYYNGRCKKCAVEISTNYYGENKERVKKNASRFYSKNKNLKPNPILVDEYNKQYLLKNKSRTCNTCLIEKNINEFGKSFNKGKIYFRYKCKECDKPDKNQRNNNIRKKRLANDPAYKLYYFISNVIRSALNGNKSGKSLNKYLSYTSKELKEHIESLFEPWMNWENWGTYNLKTWNDNNVATWKWQIDHIIPHSSFKYNSMEDIEFKKCWALSNLRPYSAKQNLIDSNRRLKTS
jgi:hypothetical protein